MQLSDLDIKAALETGSVTIDNFDETRLQPASYDVLLGYEFLIFNKHKINSIDPRKPISEAMEKITLKSIDESFILHPNEFVLGVSFDRVGVNNMYACQIVGKSSLARLGLIIHTTAGFIDPGNTLNFTLEFVNVNTVPIKLYPMMKIAQISFYELKTPASKIYGDKSLNSKYFGATTVQESQMHKNFEIVEEKKIEKAENEDVKIDEPPVDKLAVEIKPESKSKKVLPTEIKPKPKTKEEQSELF